MYINNYYTAFTHNTVSALDQFEKYLLDSNFEDRCTGYDLRDESDFSFKELEIEGVPSSLSFCLAFLILTFICDYL